MNVVPLDSRREEMWAKYVDAHPAARVFHQLNYRDMMTRTYGLDARYLLALDDGDQACGIMTLYTTRGLLAGRKVQSLPFGTYCDILAENDAVRGELIRAAIEIGRQYRAACVELKNLTRLSKDLVNELGLQCTTPYNITLINLRGGHDVVVKNYAKRLRGNLRTYRNRAEREGVSIRRMTSVVDLETFYRIYLRELRDKHRTIAKPYAQLLATYELYYPKQQMELFIAEYEGEMVGGILLYYFNGEITYEYSAMNVTYQKFGLTPLLLDHAIQDGCERGFHSFNLSVTHNKHEALMNFKLKWGASTHVLPYYYAMLTAKEPPEINYLSSYPLVRKIMPRVPLAVVHRLSAWVMKQLI